VSPAERCDLSQKEPLCSFDLPPRTLAPTPGFLRSTIRRRKRDRSIPLGKQRDRSETIGSID
jgi:hypothetical protein